jgi:phosphate transport system substrate-binding protein
VRVTVGISGTGGGFKRFAKGETDISDASRPIKAAEAKAAAEAKIEYIELPVAYDGLSIVVNKGNQFVDKLTVDDLKKIFLAGNPAKTWRDVNPKWPAMEIKIYAPGTDSGTFDYFKEVVAHDKGTSIRSDMSVSEDDNVLVRGVSGEPGAIGFFGVAYYEENKDSLKVVPIVNPKTGKAVVPTAEAIESGEYAPFSRPLFIYVNSRSAARPEVKAFVEFYLDNAADLATEVGYVALPKGVYKMAETNFRKRKTGTAYLDDDGEKIDGPVTKVYGTRD